MPDNSYILKTKIAIQSHYAVDLDGIESDSTNIRSLYNNAKASGPPDAASIYDSEITRANSDAIVPALETLAYGGVEENKELDSRFVEQHMDDTLRYLAQCYAIRREYGDVAKLYIDTSLKAEEFFRLERIHNLEVAAGIYSLDYEDSTDQVKSAQAATDGWRTNVDYDSWASSTLSKSKDKYAKERGELSQLEAATNPNAQTIADDEANIAYESGDETLYEFNRTLRADSINLTDAEARLSIAKRRQAYNQKDIAFRAARAAVSKQLACAQLWENTRHKFAGQLQR
jgi:hypothetical protein